ncbi:gamma-tubulin complex component 3-like [Lolium rigidum]|uniref:gamma-tubulin complex component 3-like n=1 Tax=Lolium rigidum TaxID=89674 RepID=UPI001F5CEE49|nr:gamma-tubulin complex component 3-like [Lolium rigidum]XP_047052441.1 gamma-tubulin complex component 3-like [Lolium rigidum]XP_047052442.1 gamma-tubulin complex component 3-like [Lolium rigidum]XP_047052443.1 gamma-tubulin complex component 3-like [Lolium rigidum]
MEDHQTQDLVKELVLRLVSGESGAGGRDAGGALRFAHRLLSSRLAPAVLPDEHALAESIKRRLAASGRPDDALAFADLHSKLSARSRPASLWPLLYLLDSLSSHRRGAAASSCLPNLPTAAPPTTAGGKPASRVPGTPLGGGVLLVSKDPDNIREIALREYTELVLDETEVSEAALVRDVLYACQGIDGRYVRYDKASDTYDLPDAVRVPRSTRTLVRKLCEVGWLFRKVRGFISDNVSRLPSDSATEVGTVAQAFCSALQEELSDYYKLLAVLESYSLNPIPTPGSDSGVSGNYLSLRRLVVWLAEPAVRMRLMAVLVDGCRGLRGGGMAGAIHGHAQHGDPMVQDFMGRLLRRVCSPLFEMVRSWVLEGELEDVFGEFFIVGQPVKAESLWREGYLIQSDMLPTFISPVLAQRILRTGKSINFLRVCCDDNGWAEAATEAAAYVGTTTSRGGLGYGQIDALEALVVEAAKRIDQRLMDVIHKRYRFKDHCLAIKRYLLLGQGDFVQYLMDVVGPELSEPANRISSFHLAGLLETAIRASDAQYDDRDILDRIKVKMMDHGDGDRGWDVFSLEYDARVPLDTVFTASVMKMYLKIFNFLWKLKRVDHSLTGVWKTMKPNCIVSSPFYKEGTSIRAQFVSVLRKCQVLFNEMNHFVTNFQYYIMFEVLEISWARFSEEMDAAKDLDDLLMGHDKYLTSIVEKSLLGERSLGILRNLFALFDIILQFRSHADRWFERIYELQLRGKGKSKTKSKETGSWLDGGRKAMIQLAGELFRKMGEDLDSIAKDYTASLDSFISQLPLQQHVDLKFLLFRLDFTEYYSRVSSSK